MEICAQLGERVERAPRAANALCRVRVRGLGDSRRFEYDLELGDELQAPARLEVLQHGRFGIERVLKFWVFASARLENYVF